MLQDKYKEFSFAQFPKHWFLWLQASYIKTTLAMIKYLLADSPKSTTVQIEVYKMKRGTYFHGNVHQLFLAEQDKLLKFKHEDVLWRTCIEGLKHNQCNKANIA